MSMKEFVMGETFRRYAVIVLSVIGLLISLYIKLYIETGDNNVLGCKINSYVNCTNVINGPYGKVFGIPLSLFGAFYFLVLIALYAVDYYNDYLIAVISLAGIVSVINFVFLELFVINHICLYCTSVHVVVVLIFILIGPVSIRNSYILLKKSYFNK